MEDRHFLKQNRDASPKNIFSQNTFHVSFPHFNIYTQGCCKMLISCSMHEMPEAGILRNSLFSSKPQPQADSSILKLIHFYFSLSSTSNCVPVL